MTINIQYNMTVASFELVPKITKFQNGGYLYPSNQNLHAGLVMF